MTDSNDDQMLVSEAVTRILAFKAQPDELTANALAEWAGRSEEHMRHFLMQSALEEMLFAIPDRPERSAEELMAIVRNAFAAEDSVENQAARSEATGERPLLATTFNVVPIQEALSTQHLSEVELRRSARAGKVTLVAGSLAAAAIAALVWWEPFSPGPWVAYESTEAPLVVALGYGAKADLHPFSHIEVRTRVLRPDVRLTKGGAKFAVTPNLLTRFAAQEFVVEIPGGSVVASGTRFNILLKPDRTGVFLTEGELHVVGQTVTPLSPGQFTNITHDGQIDPAQTVAMPGNAGSAEISRPFQDATLSEVAAAINSLNSVPQIVVMSDGLEERYTGVVDLTDPEAWLSLLAADPKLRIERGENKATISQKRN